MKRISVSGIGLRSAGLAALIALAVASAASAAPSLSFTGGLPVATNGDVLALARDGSTLYLAGRFSRVGPVTGALLALDRSTGARTDTSLVVSGNVDAVVPDGAGGFYIGGNFDSVDGSTESNLAHITSSGALDPGFSASTDAPVLALARSGQTLYVGGRFEVVDDSARASLAAVSATTGDVLSSSADVDGSINALLVSGTTLYVGGHFQHVAGTAVANLAAVSSADLSLQSGFAPAPDGAVDTLAAAASSTQFYVGGSFANIGGAARADLAEVNASDGSATSFAPNADGAVNALLLSGGTLYAGGSFANIGGQAVGSLAALDATTGTASPSFAPAPDGAVDAIAPGAGGTVLAGGSFAHVGGTAVANLAEVSASNGAVTSGFGPSPDHTVAALAVSDGGGTVLAGGDFESAGGVVRHNLAAIDLDNDTVTSFDPEVLGSAGVDTYVRSLALSGGKLWLGGQFTTVGGQPRADLAAVGADGTVATPATDTDAAVQDLVSDGSQLFVAGNFQTIAGASRTYVASLDPVSGTVSSTFNPSVDGYVYALAAGPTGTVDIGGDFGTVDGQSHLRLAALDATDGSLVTTFQPDGVGASDIVDKLFPAGSALYVSGQFNEVEGQYDGGLIGVDPATGAPLSTFTPGPDASTYDLASVGGGLFATGCFHNWDGESLSALTGFDPATGEAYGAGFDLTDQLLGSDEPPVGQFDLGGCGYSLAGSADGSTLYVGGLFNSVNGTPQGGIASFSLSSAAGGGGASGGGSGDGGAGGGDGGTASTPTVTVDPTSSSAPAENLPASTTAGEQPLRVLVTRLAKLSRQTLDTGLAASCPAGGACTVSVTSRTEPAGLSPKLVHSARIAANRKTGGTKPKTKKQQKARPKKAKDKPKKKKKTTTTTPGLIPVNAGSRKLTVRAGRSAEITFTVSKALRKLLTHPGQQTVAVTVTVRRPGATTVTVHRAIILEGR